MAKKKSEKKKEDTFKIKEIKLDNFEEKEINLKDTDIPKGEKTIKKIKYGEKLGNAGFILGILGIVFGILIAPILGILIAIIGFGLCFFQQKNNPTKKGKLGLTLNVIGFVASVVWWIIVIKVIFPIIQNQLQSFPSS